ncbi:MAG TPA: peptide deformylase [Phycisphaerae bacterium]|jgi:peptide deformylase
MAKLETIAPQNLRIISYPDPALRSHCTPVETFDESLSALALRMLELMREARGVGLAAPQLGVPLRLFVCNPTGQPTDDVVCVNPHLLDLEGAVEAEEGCLSIPGVQVPMRRAQSARLRFQDLIGQQRELQGEGMPARIWQHENDHLDGKLIIDSMSAAVEIANRRALKQLRESYKPRRK